MFNISVPRFSTFALNLFLTKKLKQTNEGKKEEEWDLVKKMKYCNQHRSNGQEQQKIHHVGADFYDISPL